MKKTNRKNKTGLVVNWPTGFYIVDNGADENGTATYPNVPTLWDHNRHFATLITLRVRLSKAVEEDKSVTVLGTIKGELGRPKKVYANLPVSQETIDAARTAGVVLNDNIPHIVNVMSVTPVTEDTVNNVEGITRTDKTTVSSV